jgi:hypothetical protein
VVGVVELAFDAGEARRLRTICAHVGFGALPTPVRNSVASVNTPFEGSKHSYGAAVSGPAGEPLNLRHELGLRPCPNGFFKFLSTGLDGLARIALTRGPPM